MCVRKFRCVMGKVLNCGLEVSEFERQTCCYVHFRTNTPLGKAWTHLSPSRYGLNCFTAVILQGWIWHQIPNVRWYAIKTRNQINLLVLIVWKSRHCIKLCVSTLVIWVYTHTHTIYIYIYIYIYMYIYIYIYI